MTNRIKSKGVGSPPARTRPLGRPARLWNRLRKSFNPVKDWKIVGAIEFPEELEKKRRDRHPGPRLTQGAAPTEAVWVHEAAGRKERCIRYVQRVAQIAVVTAPKRRQDWSLRLRLKEDVLPQCSMNLVISSESVRLRFRTIDGYTHQLLLAACDEIKATVTVLVGRTTEIEILNEYYGLC